MKTIFPVIKNGLISTLLLCSHTYAAQVVTPDVDTLFIEPQQNLNYSINYNVTIPESNTETGIGLRVHYNSSQLTPGDSTLYPNHAQLPGDISDDTEDFDNDPATDKFFVVAWIDFTAQWPGSSVNLPINLLQTNFTTKPDFSGSTTIRLSKTSTARATELQAGAMHICAKPTINLSTGQPTSQEDNSTTNYFYFQTEIPITDTHCQALTLNYQLTGTAQYGTDYQPDNQPEAVLSGQTYAKFGITPLDDDLVEDDETIIFSLLEGDNYIIGSPSSVTMMLQSEDETSILPEVSLSTSGKNEFTEASSGSLLIFVTRSNTDLSQPLDVFISTGGSAISGTDYLPVPDKITIPAGSDQAFFALVMRDDGDNETDETLSISIASDTNYQRDSSSSLQLLLRDDEINQQTSLAISNNTNRVKPIPTLSEWLLILTSLLLSVLAVTHLRQQETMS